MHLYFMNPMVFFYFRCVAINLTTIPVLMTILCSPGIIILKFFIGTIITRKKLAVIILAVQTDIVFLKVDILNLTVHIIRCNVC